MRAADKALTAALIAAALSRSALAYPAVDVVSQKWQRYAGAIAQADITIKNNNGYGVKDIVIECVFRGRSGTAINSKKQTIYDTLPGGATKTFFKIRIGFVDRQATSGACWVVSTTPDK